MKKLLFIPMLLCAMNMEAQTCQINHVTNPSFLTGAPVFSPMGANVPDWTVDYGTPDIYPNTTIFMWGSAPGSGMGEGVFQDLCEPLIAGTDYNFCIDAATSSRNFGTMEVVLSMSGGGAVTQTILSTGLSNTGPLLTICNFSFTANDNYDRIEIHPISSGPGLVMDIIVDNALIELANPLQGTTQNYILNCCEEQTLSIWDMGVPYSNITWYDMNTMNVIGSGNMLTIMPAPPQSTYLIEKQLVTCSGSCTIWDTVIVDCIDLWTLPMAAAARPASPLHVTDVSHVQSASTGLLHQNIPNPFNENTNIRYELPEQANEAMIVVFNLKGEQMRKFNLPADKEGKVEISSGELSAGMYIYSLVVNGQVADTKRMILLDR